MLKVIKDSPENNIFNNKKNKRKRKDKLVLSVRIKANGNTVRILR